MFKRSLSRGTSIVAALALLGVLSVALIFTQLLLPDVNAASQSAQAATPLPTARPTAAGPSAAQASARCSAAKKAAINNGGQSPELNQSFTKNTLEQNICIGAVLDDALVSALVAQKVQNPQLDERAYKCVGEESKVYMDAKGTGTIIARASVKAPEGKCIVTFCDASGTKCSAASQTIGGQTIQAWAASPETRATLSPEMLKSAYNLGNADPQTQATLNDAFNERVDQQIGSQKAQLENVQAKLDALSACAQGESTGACSPEAIQSTQAEMEKQKQLLADLQKQKADFAASKAEMTIVDKPVVPTACKSANCVDGQGRTYDPPKTGFGTPPGGTPGDGEPKNSGGGLGDIGKMLQGFLGGLMKGLGGGAGAGGPACPSDPSAYAQQQQQYQAQMQQYQYQLQQYNLYLQQQQYQAETTGYVPMTRPTPPVAPVACTPTSSSNTCAAPPAQPSTACPAGTTLKPITTQQSNGASCTTGWQCASSTATTPTAQLSCQPQVADVGMSVSISYGCTNATGSTGSGFFTNNAISGSTTTVLTAPPAGVTKATFGLTCVNQNLSGQASCDVQVSRPSIVLVANPKVVATSTASTIGWVTSGMSSCVVSSPQQSDFTAANAGNTSVNGMATTSPITRDTDILLRCVTLGGGTRSATTTITSTAAGGGGQGTTTVASFADGKSIARGAVNTVRWSSTNAPAGSKMSLWLYDVRLDAVTALIKNELAASSTYAWTLPNATDACNNDSNLVCGTDLVPGRQYGIEADLYTGDPANASYGAQAFTPEVFTISQ